MLPFFLVDVFTTRHLAGNPLAVVSGAEHVPDETMRRIAREFNQSETTFVLPPSKIKADWRLRSFTPTGVEVFGAGHNSLGAWWWLAASGALKFGDSGGQFTQEIGPHLLPVDVVATAGKLSGIGLTQAPPVFGKTHDHPRELAISLGLDASDLRTSLPAQVVSTGAAHLLVPLRDRSAVAKAQPDAARLRAELASVDGQGCYLFSLDPLDAAAVAHARFFNPTAGISEDAATGSAAGPLACLLVKHGIVQEGAIIEQGHALDRPSLIRAEVSGTRVRVFGQCVVTAEGMLRIE